MRPVLAHRVDRTVPIVAARTHATTADGQNVQCKVCVNKYHVPKRIKVPMIDDKECAR